MQQVQQRVDERLALLVREEVEVLDEDERRCAVGAALLQEDAEVLERRVEVAVAAGPQTELVRQRHDAGCVRVVEVAGDAADERAVAAAAQQPLAAAFAQ